jgi:hypothetical protein
MIVLSSHAFAARPSTPHSLNASSKFFRISGYCAARSSLGKSKSAIAMNRFRRILFIRRNLVQGPSVFGDDTHRCSLHHLFRPRRVISWMPTGSRRSSDSRRVLSYKPVRPRGQAVGRRRQARLDETQHRHRACYAALTQVRIKKGALVSASGGKTGSFEVAATTCCTIALSTLGSPPTFPRRWALKWTVRAIQKHRQTENELKRVKTELARLLRVVSAADKSLATDGASISDEMRAVGLKM